MNNLEILQFVESFQFGEKDKNLKAGKGHNKAINNKRDFLKMLELNFFFLLSQSFYFLCLPLKITFNFSLRIIIFKTSQVYAF